MSNPSVTSTAAAPSLADALFGGLWPDRTTPGRPRLVAASAAGGLIANGPIWRLYRYPAR